MFPPTCLFIYIFILLYVYLYVLCILVFINILFICYFIFESALNPHIEHENQ